jgi:hypothetical protein
MQRGEAYKSSQRRFPMNGTKPGSDKKLKLMEATANRRFEDVVKEILDSTEALISSGKLDVSAETAIRALRDRISFAAGSVSLCADQLDNVLDRIDCVNGVLTLMILFYDAGCCRISSPILERIRDDMRLERFLSAL